MFANGILCNSEAWHNITKKHIEELEVMDRSLLRYILNAHSKVQNEFLYLETGVLGIKQIITSRKCLYLHTLLQRDDEELTKRIYNSQKNNPSKGDWIELIQQDFRDLGIPFDEDEIKKETKVEFKSRIKKLLRVNFFEDLKNAQKEHSKIRNICYQTFKVQDYLKTHILNNHEVSLLFALQSIASKYFKANFPFHSEKMCPYCGKEEDSQEHCLKCESIYPTSMRNNQI